MTDDQRQDSPSRHAWRVPEEEQLPSDAYHVWKPRPLLRSVHWKPVPAPPRETIAGAYEVFLEQRALRAVHEHLWMSPADEAPFGFLVGDLCEDPDTTRRYVVVTRAVPSRFPFQEEGPEQIPRAAILAVELEADRRRGVLAGWYHRHAEGDPALTEADVATHEEYFTEPWQIALLLVTSHAAPAGGCFGRSHAGLVAGQSLPFFEMVSNESLLAQGVRRSLVDWTNVETVDAIRLEPLSRPAPPPVPEESQAGSVAVEPSEADSLPSLAPEEGEGDGLPLDLEEELEDEFEVGSGSSRREPEARVDEARVDDAGPAEDALAVGVREDTEPIAGQPVETPPVDGELPDLSSEITEDAQEEASAFDQKVTEDAERAELEWDITADRTATDELEADERATEELEADESAVAIEATEQLEEGGFEDIGAVAVDEPDTPGEDLAEPVWDDAEATAGSPESPALQDIDLDSFVAEVESADVSTQIQAEAGAVEPSWDAPVGVEPEEESEGDEPPVPFRRETLPELLEEERAPEVVEGGNEESRRPSAKTRRRTRRLLVVLGGLVIGAAIIASLIMLLAPLVRWGGGSGPLELAPPAGSGSGGEGRPTDGTETGGTEQGGPGVSTPERPEATVQDLERLGDRLLESVSRYYGLAVARDDGRATCVQLQDAYVEVENRWMAYNVEGKARFRGRLPGALGARDERLYDGVRDVEREFGRSGCERP